MQKVDILVLHYDDDNFTEMGRLLRSLTKEKSLIDKIIIVNNACSDLRQLNVVSSRNNLQDVVDILCPSKNLGYTGGVNLALRGIAKDAEEKIFLVCNNDSVLKKGFIRQWLDSIDHLEKEVGKLNIGVVGPTSLSGETNKIIGTKKKLVPVLESFENDYSEADFQKEFVRSDFISGAIWGGFLSQIKGLNLLDEDYFAYYEVYDLCLRFNKFGIKNYWFPKLKSFHFGGRKERESKIALYFVVRNKLLFLKKNYSFIRFLTYLPVFLYKFFLINPFCVYKKENNLNMFKITCLAIYDFTQGFFGIGRLDSL